MYGIYTYMGTYIIGSIIIFEISENDVLKCMSFFTVVVWERET